MPFVVPDACTLPTAERPLRLAEFDALFATAVRHVEPVTATRARLHLTGRTGLTATVRDLTTREAACCSFFAFTVTPAAPSYSSSLPGESVTLDIEVPPQHADVLASLTARATQAAQAAHAARVPADGMPPTRSKVSGILAVVACAACCALPFLIAAGVLTAAGAAILEKTLLAAAAGLAAVALGTWWLHRRRTTACGCGGAGCGC
jgi:hypothetical protein